ncbi:MAG: TlpA family protein disulfide reductase [Chloroflexi bacterium]|nr:TlpA family protein disulfide reductase [Chloroflexota bacterium]
MSELTHKLPGIKTQSTPGRTLVLIFGALLIIGLISIFGWKLFDSSQTLAIDSPPPDFTLSLFEGGQLTLSELRGQVVVVNFWASWCVPCRDEAPILERAWRRYRDRGVLFIGIDYLDTDQPDQAFLAEFGITYPNGPDVGTKIARQYRITGVPETFFVARDGQLGDMVIGPLTEERLTGAIDRLLQE